MTANELEPGKCYIKRDRNAGVIFEVKNAYSTELSVLVEYRKMINFSAGLENITVEFDFHFYEEDEDKDCFEPCDVALLDKLIKLYDIFRASAKPLIKQAMKQP